VSNVTCGEFQELIAGAVDRCLHTEDQRAFDRHAGACPSCRAEYDAERSTKDLLRRRTRMASLPAGLHASILETLARENRPIARSGPLGHRFLPPIVAVVATAALLLVLTRLPEETGPGGSVAAAGFAPNNVLFQSTTNFHRFLRGEIAPEVTSSDAGSLHSFFAGRTEFPVAVPTMLGCALLGAVLNEHEGTPVAHLVYRSGDTLVYLFQTCWKTVQQGKRFAILPSVQEELLRTGWHMEEAGDGDAVVMHATERTLCIAIARMTPERLASLIRSADTPEGPLAVP
jgi:anti-sigma factor RsiW